MTTKIWQLTALGQSIWYDYMERHLLESGELAAMANRGDIRGLTSNPSIFNNAIAKSKDYDSALIPMAWSGYTNEMILEHLMIEDIKRTADILRFMFDSTHGGDGFVSIEVRPDYAYDTEKTISEASRLWKLVNRPNVMIKIPATKPGLEAIRHSIAAGININITLIFSNERYKEVMDAYLSGLEDRISAGKPIDHIYSVASFFVSRIDSKVDKYLEPISKGSGKDATVAKSLLGKLAIANARLAYQEFRKVFEGDRFCDLKEKGATLQRPLWASTSTKNPSYPDTMYIDELIGAHTVNTVPPQTLAAFKDHGKVELTIEKNLAEAENDFAKLGSIGLTMAQVTQELEEEGVKTFSESFYSILSTIQQRQESAIAELGPLAKSIPGRIRQLDTDNFVKRFYSNDAGLWSSDPGAQEEIRKRMGWMILPAESDPLLPELEQFVAEVHAAGYSQVLLLGMGGSSLTPEVLSLIFEDSITGLKLTVLDSTDPAQVVQAARKNPVTKTLHLISSKSGGTAEVNALFNYFWKRAQETVGDKAGDHFIAITDPGTSLEKLAHEKRFRKVFLANPNIGGRYSALSAFGLVPAALMGINAGELLNCAAWMASECNPDQPVGRNPGIVLGVVLAEAYRSGRDKLTLIADPEVAPFGAWLEQLVAESSGKLGKGIVPINGEPIEAPEAYGSDRFYYYLRRNGKYDKKVKKLQQAGHPVLIQDIEDNTAVASEFYKWEIAVSTACSIIRVNAFDQPDVQDSKNRTMAKISFYQAHHQFNGSKAAVNQHGISIYGNVPSGDGDIFDIVARFLKSGKPGDYVAINAFVKRDKKFETTLMVLRQWIMENTRLATMVGFGPRFLHSTGQLHKGGSNNGVFLVLTAEPFKDLEIPLEGLSFGTLEFGQALGDVEALESRKRRVIHVHLENPDLLATLVDKITNE